jgi:glucan biosynthesis protein C
MPKCTVDILCRCTLIFRRLRQRGVDNLHRSPPKESAASEAGRLHYLDWLRVLAILGVFLFHASNVFNDQDFVVKNAEQSSLVTGIQAFFFPWGMPLFFLIAGAGTWFALRRRTSGQYARERSSRLLVPFIFGSILLSPVQFYCQWRYQINAGIFDGSFTQFLGSLPWGPNPRIFAVAGYHLWFLGFLFSFSLLALPLFRWLQGKSGQAFVSKLGRVCQYRGGILVFLLLPVIARLSLQPFFPYEHDWADFLFLFSFFVIGYVVMADERFRQAVWRDWPVTLTVGTLAFLGAFAIVISTGELDIEAVPKTPLEFLWWGLVATCGWCWTAFFLFVGMRFLNFSNRLLQYGQDAIVPFYLVHQPVIVVLSYYVVQWNAALALKMLIVVVGSFAISVGLYEFIIKRIGILQPLFGMKARRRHGAQAAAG